MKLEWRSCFHTGIGLLLLYLGIPYRPSFTSCLGLPGTGAMLLLIGVPAAAAVYRLISEEVKHIRADCVSHA